MPAGNTVEMNILEPFTVESFKQVISQEKGIHPLHQQITFNGRVLEDGHTFDEYNIQIRSILDLVVRPGSKSIYCVLLWNMLSHMTKLRTKNQLRICLWAANF